MIEHERVETPATGPSFIDLFAGCGGLSLGFEAAGLELVAAVERSDMAAETHYCNFHRRGEKWDHDEWRDEWKEGYLGRSTDEQAKHGTVVGDILNFFPRAAPAETPRSKLEEYSAALDYLKSKDVDLLAGGPPCQGFSMAGRRDPRDERNRLPNAFLDMVEALVPRAVVIENVLGINHAFRNHGRTEPALLQLRRQLEETTDEGYVVLVCELNARHYGVAQNRPRMMLIALRRDVADAAGIDRSMTERPWRSADAWLQGEDGCEQPPLTPTVGSRVDRAKGLREFPAREAIADLGPDGYTLDSRDDYQRRPDLAYAEHLRYGFNLDRAPATVSEALNQEPRNHSIQTRDRFALYRYLAQAGIDSGVLAIPRRQADPRRAYSEVATALGDAAGQKLNGEPVVEMVLRLGTKKHTQRIINPDAPAPTVVTLPDDYVHPTENRIMTVREMARFQSFPDWFKFMSKATTGSHRRKTEVPQYSQVGNAVPPLMAQAVGELIKGLLMQAHSPTALAEPVPLG